jgi:homopolymeric O-antigen transport system ATP-binding protein
MSDIAIQADRLSKLYRIGQSQHRHNTLRDQIEHGVRGLFHRNGQKRSGDRTIWALKDTSFEIRRGEVVGVVGRNGAGKSTLLKILSRITEPTSGYARIYGRVSSLLEVGTGFHAELTGRENVYLSGAILGMSRREMDRKFDEIVSFAEIETFIDTPVKRYSSGMYLRLAFAVAAHLETDILLVDEVLAVGDAAFQKKCIGKMSEVAHRDRTVLFVSHNLGAIETLCTSAMWIDRGTLALRGPTSSTVQAYLKSFETASAQRVDDWQHSGTGEAHVVAARVLDSDGYERDTFSMGESLVVEYTVEFHRAFDTIQLAMVVRRSDKLAVIDAVSADDAGFVPEKVGEGRRTFRLEIPNCLLFPNVYDISLYVGSRGVKLDFVENVLRFSIVQSAAARRTSRLLPEWGVYYTPSIWTQR